MIWIRLTHFSSKQTCVCLCLSPCVCLCLCLYVYLSLCLSGMTWIILTCLMWGLTSPPSQHRSLKRDASLSLSFSMYLSFSLSLSLPFVDDIETLIKRTGPTRPPSQRGSLRRAGQRRDHHWHRRPTRPGTNTFHKKKTNRSN